MKSLFGRHVRAVAAIALALAGGAAVSGVTVRVPYSPQGQGPSLPGDEDDVVVVKDWQSDVTKSDLGSNYFSGNGGATDKDGLPYSKTALECGGAACGLRFTWDFRISSDGDAFTGYFFCKR